MTAWRVRKLWQTAVIFGLCFLIVFSAAFAQEPNPSTPGVIPLEIKDAPAPEAAGTSAETPAPPEPEPQKIFNMVVLQGLNKVTARAETIEVPFGAVARFGNVEIIAKACWQAPPEERPENAALLEIWERKSDESPTHLFTGWMFSSSPSLSSLEHPVYDVTVIECQSREEKE